MGFIQHYFTGNLFNDKYDTINEFKAEKFLS